MSRKMLRRSVANVALCLVCSLAFGALFASNTYATCGDNNGGGCDDAGGANSSGGNPNAALSTRSTGWVSVSVADVKAGAVPGMRYNADGSITVTGVHTAHTSIGDATFSAQQIGGSDHILVHGAVSQGGTVNGVYYPAGTLIAATGYGNSSDRAWLSPSMGGYAKQSSLAHDDNYAKQLFYSLVQQGRMTPGDYDNFLKGSNLSMIAYWDGMLVDGSGITYDPDHPPVDEGLTPGTPTPPDPGMVPDCGDGLNWGDTEGHVKINNLSDATQGGWVEGEIWGRPGDSIRFAVDYCFAAQAVRGHPHNDQNTWDDREKNYFQIDASPSQLYWFGDHSVQGGVRYNYVGGGPVSDPYAAFPGISYFDKTGSYKFQLFSPSNRTASGYNCQIFDFTPYFVAFGFQIPGATTQCAASGRTGNGSGWENVGSEIRQTLTYDRITAWRIYKRWTNFGTCAGCSYEEASCVATYHTRRKSVEEYNGLKDQNGNYGSPYKSLAAALAGSGNAQIWGLAEKFSDNAMHGGSDDDPACNITGQCAPNAWKWDTQCWVEPVPADPITGLGGKAGYYEPCSLDCDQCHTGAYVTSYESDGKVYSAPTYDYSHDWENLGTQRSSSAVKIPFSFMTSATSGIIGHSSGVVYLGEDVSSTFSVSILPRTHTDVHPGESYATIVPAEIKAVEFIVREDVGMNSLTGSSNAGGSDPCAFYSGYMVDSSECNTIWRVGSPLNPDGRYSGYSYGQVVEDRNVPDLEKYPVGSKYCVAVGVSSSDSHSQPDNTGSVSGMSSLSGWRISGASCRTIAKKPNFQVWNGGVYTNGGIETIGAYKDVGKGLGHHNDPTSIFGSWAEYYIVAAGDVYGMSSGSAPGYYGYSGNSLGLKGGANIDKSNCDMTKMTVANDNCSSSITGKSGIQNLSQDIILERVRSRYTDGTIDETPAAGNTLSNGARYVKKKGNYNLSTFISAIANSTAASDQSEKYCISQANTNIALKRCEGPINDESLQTTSNYASNTLVIHVTGTLTIDRNICNGNGDCNTDNNTIRLGDTNSQYFDNIYALPQVLLIADGGIRIENQVNQIDAWLITNGNVNTCTGFSVGSGSERDCKSTLIVNGPVFAKSITLNRTGGAYPNVGNFGTSNVLRKDLSGKTELNSYGYVVNKANPNGSVTPAEIFNLRPDVYLWAYSQAQRFSQASVTYTRELAPRY